MKHAPIRLGIAGCGRIARAVHLPFLVAQPNVQIVAIADADPLALAAARRSAPSAASLSRDAELYGRSDLDAIIVCLPSHAHSDAAIATLEADKALYLEKPLATDLEAARAAVAAARRAGRPAMVGFNFRFHPLVVELKRRVMDGEIGEVRSWRSTFSTRAHELPAWKRTVASGGGVALDLLSHHVDLLRFITGREVRDVFAIANASVHCEEDTAALQMVLDTGLVAQATASWSLADDDRIEVVGDAGALRLDRHRALGLDRRPASALNSRGQLLTGAVPALDVGFACRRLSAPRREPSYALALTHFLGCVGSGEMPSPGLDDGLRSLEVIVAARASVRDGHLHRVGG